MTPRLLAPGSLALSLALMPLLAGWFDGWAGNRAGTTNALATLLGDGRRLFSNHFFVKADVYFHSGFYPSIFDRRKAAAFAHAAGEHEPHDHAAGGCEHDFVSPPGDWIERFGRAFYPATHTHLDEAGGGQTGEMLPWLRLSTAMDPQRVESYVVGAYWLGERMGRTADAEALLREGLRANPGSYELVFELGRIAHDVRRDPRQALHLWTLAERYWTAAQAALPEPDYFTLANILAHQSAALEELGDLPAAVEKMERAERVSGGKGHYAGRLQRLRDARSALPREVSSP